nr:TRAP transporter small permease [Alkalicoccus halolimnae]
MRYIEGVSSFLLAVLTVVVFSEVLSRYVFQTPLVFSNEMTQLLFPWMIFVAAIAVTHDDAHLSVSYFRDRLPYFMQKGLYMFSKVVMLIFSVFMIVSSMQFVGNVSGQVMPVLRISSGWLASSVVFSFIFISLVLIYQIYLISTNKMLVPGEEEAYLDMDNDR